MESFCKEIVQATQHVAVAYKPNLAFFEPYGAEGWAALDRIIDSIPEDCLVIADAKRGDIGNTAKKYATAIFDGLGADAITVAPYMGEDSVRPFTDRSDKWTILLALTSNPGADDFEFHGTPPLFERVLERAQSWGTPDNLMFVIGATRPELLSRVRELAPDSFLLVPGVGAQGGSLELVAKQGLNSKCGLLVNSSRGIIYAGGSEASIEKAMQKTKDAAEDLARQMSETLQQ
jgi:orotidine-5'-phosphate decarboxylase